MNFKIAPEVDVLVEGGWRGAYFLMQGLRNAPAHPELEALKAEAVEAARASHAPESLREVPVLEGFRALHRAVGRANRKTIPSPENLLRLVLRTGTLPPVNLLVDIYNLVSLHTGLALGAHDLAAVQGDIHLRLADGTEGFHPLGEEAPKAVASGEYAYVDGANDVLCRLEVRQVEKSKVGLETTGCFYIVQGNAATPWPLVREGAERVIELNRRFCGGEVRWLHAPWMNDDPSQP